MLEQVPNGILIAAGTVAASMIAGSFAYLNLVVSKEQKISEFRQTWIDELRKDLSILISAATNISAHAQVVLVRRENEEEFSLLDAIEPMQPFLTEAYGAYHRITLRLNPLEHERLKALVVQLEESLSNPENIGDAKNFGNICGDIDDEAHKVLKTEWERVKKGEATYRVTKGLSIGLAAFAVSFALYVWLSA